MNSMGSPSDHREIWLTGWTSKLRPVAVVTLIRDSTGAGLAEAKGCLDQLLAGNPVRLEFRDSERCSHFIQDATHLGVITDFCDQPGFVGGPNPRYWDALAEAADDVWRDPDGRLVMRFQVESQNQSDARGRSS
jgi:hypothetical protein